MRTFTWRQLFDAAAVGVLLVFTALGDATAMLGAALLVLVVGFIAFPAERRVGLTTAAVGAIVALALALIRAFAR